MNTEIQTLKMQLEEMQLKLAALEEAENANAKATQSSCLIPSPMPGELFYFITEVDELFIADSCRFDFPAGMHFADKRQADCYAEALTTFILLRKQPGSEAAIDQKVQYNIETQEDGVLYVDNRLGNEYKIRNISPCFNTLEAAQKAIDTLGAERILNMFKYFHS